MHTVNKDQYFKTGFQLIKNLFDPQEVIEVSNCARNIFRMQLRNRKLPCDSESEFEQSLFQFFSTNQAEFINCGKQCQHLIELHRLSLDKRITDKVSLLGIEFPNIATRPVMFFNSRHLATSEVYWRVFAHQDWASMQGSLNSMVVWLPLMSVDRSVGALEIIPGSHLRGLVTAEKSHGFGRVENTDEAEWTSVEMEAGDALFFSSFLIHRSGTNITDQIRWSCHFRYNDLSDQTFVERGYPHPYIYKPQDDLLTPNFPTIEAVKTVFKLP